MLKICALMSIPSYINNFCTCATYLSVLSQPHTGCPRWLSLRVWNYISQASLFSQERFLDVKFIIQRVLNLICFEVQNFRSLKSPRVNSTHTHRHDKKKNIKKQIHTQQNIFSFQSSLLSIMNARCMHAIMFSL